MPIILPSGGSNSTNGGNISKQLDNIKYRLNSVGAGNTDSRNWFEKLTNLPQNQNALFDVLDLIQRPEQAISNTVSSLVSPTDNRQPFQAALDGISGRKKVSYSNVLGDLGVKNKYLKNGLGLALDIGLDPTTYIGAGAISKGAQLAARGAKAVLPEIATRGITAAKDGIASVFDVNHPLKKTLDGGTSDALIKIRRNNINDQRYYGEKSFNDVLQSTKAVGGDISKGTDVTNLIEKDLGGVNRAASTDAKVADAAQQLTNSYSWIRDLAASTGRNINDLQGYMKRIWTKEAEDFYGKTTTGVSRVGGNKGQFAQRKYKDMTTEEVNAAMKDNSARLMKIDQRLADGKISNAKHAALREQIIAQTPDFNVFEPNAFFASARGQQQLIKAILADDAKNQILGNANFARKVPKGQNAVVRDGESLITTDQYHFFNDTTQKVGTGTTQYVVTKGAKQVLDNYKNHITDEGLQKFNSFYDKLHNTWKKFSLFSGGFHIRNDAGNKFNMWIGGMPLHSIPIEWKNSIKITSLASKAEEKLRMGLPLTAEEGKASTIYDLFKRQGLKDSNIFQNEIKTGNDGIQKALENRSKTGAASVLNKVLSPFETSKDIGIKTDEYNRLAYFKWLMESKKMHPSDAAAKVREVLFDYGDLTPAEQQIKRLVPFYTWTRKNLPFQMKNLLLQPAKYTTVDKTRHSMEDTTGINDNNLPDWLKESFAAPVLGDGQGNGKLLNLNLPLSDLTKLSNPVKLVSDSITPMAKLPIELASNFNTFLGKPIESFKGETEKMFGMDVPVKLAYAVKQLGAVRNLSGYTNQAINNDVKGLLETMLTGGIAKDHNADKAKLAKLYEQLNQMQDMAKKYKQDTGKDLPTMKDLGK